jgi:apolipoprotein N-acyltransferase
LLNTPKLEMEPLRIAAVQPNIPQEIRFHERENEREILETLAHNHQIAASVLPTPQLILWPEAAIPGGLLSDEEIHQFGLEAAKLGDFSLLLGSLDYDPDPKNPEELLVYNAAMLLTRGGQKVQTFRKIHLVIFGEYLPFRGLFPSFITDLVPGDLSAGDEFRVLTMEKPPVKLGPLVCFEDTVPTIVRGLTLRGAQLLVNITNDGWFLHTVGAEQHLANAVLRTVEVRRPLVRCANTGVTCAIDAYGRVDRWTENFSEAVGAGTIRVPKNGPLTLYARWGNWVAFLCAGITGAVLVMFVPGGGARRRLGKAAAKE